VITLSARYRLFIHNPPSESSAGHPLYMPFVGTERSGSREWRTNDFEAAVRKAERELEFCAPSGWVSVQAMDGDKKLGTAYVTSQRDA